VTIQNAGDYDNDCGGGSAGVCLFLIVVDISFCLLDYERFFNVIGMGLRVARLTFPSEEANQIENQFNHF